MGHLIRINTGNGDRGDRGRSTDSSFDPIAYSQQKEGRGEGSIQSMVRTYIINIRHANEGERGLW